MPLKLPTKELPWEDRAIQVAKDFEDFAYIVSHDLSAPLRHVREFTKLLVGHRSKENLSEDEMKYVMFLEKSLQQLDDMQTALLGYSRLNTVVEPMRMTNFNHVYTTAMKMLEQKIYTYKPVIDCGELPSIMAETKRMEMLFFNLLDNALKFHPEGARERKVTIRATDEGAFWNFSIKDNGIGIDKEYHGEVFRLFRRLQPDIFPGIGAGLTVAQKIVKRHGGEINIISEEGHGAEFIFSIVKA